MRRLRRAVATRWCAACARQLCRSRPDEPHLIAPRVDPGRAGLLPRPVRGRSPRRDRRRSRSTVAPTLIPPLGAALRGRAAAPADLGRDRHAAGHRPRTTRRSPPRRRGEPRHPDGARAATASLDGVNVVQALRMRGTGPRLGRAVQRRRGNATVAGPGPSCAEPQKRWQRVLVVDDIVTTGSTASESVRVLQTSGCSVWPPFSLAHA